MDLFDIIGPVMIGPSSSHTAGAARIGRVVRQLLGEDIVKADIGLHGSFSKTAKGHGTDKAVVGGLMGFDVDDARLRDALEIAAERGMAVSFFPVIIKNAHPNSLRVTATGVSGATHRVEASSIGGGRIMVHAIDGLPAEFSGEAPTLVVQHLDLPGTIARVSQNLAHAGINIAAMRVFRNEQGGDAVMVIELDDAPDRETLDGIKALDNVRAVTMLDPL